MLSSHDLLGAFQLRLPPPSVEKIGAAVREAMASSPSSGLSQQAIETLFLESDPDCFLEVNETGWLNMRLSFSGDAFVCERIVQALTPLAAGPAYLKLFDQDQAPSSSEALYYYPLGGSDAARRASRIEAAFDAATDVLDGVGDLTPNQANRLRALCLEFQSEFGPTDDQSPQDVGSSDLSDLGTTPGSPSEDRMHTVFSA